MDTVWARHSIHANVTLAGRGLTVVPIVAATTTLRVRKVLASVTHVTTGPLASSVSTASEFNATSYSNFELINLWIHTQFLCNIIFYRIQRPFYFSLTPPINRWTVRGSYQTE